jgi:hypothetical protein
VLVPVLAALLTLAAPEPERAVARALADGKPAGATRAVAATRPLLGAPYVLSPLGEGSGRDPDPRFRLDAFDCMTFVETAVALGSAGSLDEARVALDDIRYSGAPSWANRNHEVLSQWIPANLAKGWIAPATPAPPGADAPRLAAKEYTPATWDAVRAAGRSIPGLSRGRLPLGRFVAPFVAPAEAPLVADRLADGAIVFVLREDAPGRATLVTHAGLVVRGAGGAALVRHATSTKGVEKVIEEPLDRFLRREARAYPRWPLAGLSFFTVLDATARVHALASARPGRAGEAAAASPPPGL